MLLRRSTLVFIMLVKDCKTYHRHLDKLRHGLIYSLFILPISHYHMERNAGAEASSNFTLTSSTCSRGFHINSNLPERSHHLRPTFNIRIFTLQWLTVSHCSARSHMVVITNFVTNAEITQDAKEMQCTTKFIAFLCVLWYIPVAKVYHLWYEG